MPMITSEEINGMLGVLRSPKSVRMPLSELRRVLHGRVDAASAQLISDIADAILDYHHHVDCYSALQTLKDAADNEFQVYDDRHSEIMMEVD